MTKLFGTDGIRGKANTHPMDAKNAFAIGQAVTKLFAKRGSKTRILIGKDTRISGYMLESSLEAGITSMGGNAYLLGVLPTPGIAYVTESMRADAGIVISASHNPFQDNGIKLFSGSGTKLSCEQEEAIERFVVEEIDEAELPSPNAIGRAYRMSDVLGRYIVFLKNTFPRHLSMDGIKIVLDTAHGATYKVAPDAFWELGAEVVTINDKPNGLNINQASGALFPETLQEKVLQTGADLGLAFDGDGDRLIAVDEKGQLLNGDQILLICAKQKLAQGKLKNNLLVGTVMSNLGLVVACKKLGLRFHASLVGDRNVLEDMFRLQGTLGGEQSGHIIFLDHHKTGDGILSGMQLIAAMIGLSKPLSELRKTMDIYPQELINVPVGSKPELSTQPKIQEAVVTAEQELGDNGRVLVRYSGTENICRVMVEGPDLESTKRICRQIADVIQTSLGK